MRGLVVQWLGVQPPVGVEFLTLLLPSCVAWSVSSPGKWGCPCLLRRAAVPVPYRLWEDREANSSLEEGAGLMVGRES